MWISLNSLAQVVIDDSIAVDFLLASHGSVCAIVNTACCT